MHSRVQKSRHEAAEESNSLPPLFFFQWKTFSLIINDPSRWQIIICFMPCVKPHIGKKIKFGLEEMSALVSIRVQLGGPVGSNKG